MRYTHKFVYYLYTCYFSVLWVKPRVSLFFISLSDCGFELQNSVEMAVSNVEFPSTTKSEFYRIHPKKIIFIHLLPVKPEAADFKVQTALGDSDKCCPKIV